MHFYPNVHTCAHHPPPGHLNMHFKLLMTNVRLDAHLPPKIQKGRPYRYTFFSHQCAPVLIAATRASASPWYIIDSVMCTALRPPASWCAPWGGVRYFGGGEGVVGRGAVQVPILLVLYRREKDRRRKIYQVCCVFFAPAGRSVQGLPNGWGGGRKYSSRGPPPSPLSLPPFRRAA